MAEFSSFVIQPKGHALMSKLIAGSGTCNFSAIKHQQLSTHKDSLNQDDFLTNIKQSTEFQASAESIMLL